MKRWAAGVVTIAVTFIVTVVFVYVVSLALATGSESIRLPLLIVAAVIGLLGAIGFLVVAFSLYGLINGREPLGLPEGSVRALIALLILVIFAAMTIFFFAEMRKSPVDAAASDLAKQVLTVLGTLLTAISSFYFGSQSATSAAKAASGNRLGGGPDGGEGGNGSQGGGDAAGGGEEDDRASGRGGPEPAGEGGDVALTRNLRVMRPLKLKRRPAIVPEEKYGMEQAD